MKFGRFSTNSGCNAAGKGESAPACACPVAKKGYETDASWGARPPRKHQEILFFVQTPLDWHWIFFSCKRPSIGTNVSQHACKRPSRTTKTALHAWLPSVGCSKSGLWRMGKMPVGTRFRHGEQSSVHRFRRWVRRRNNT